MERIATPESRAILTHDRLIGLANRFLTGISTDAAASSTVSTASSSSSRAASRLPTLPTPDYITAAFFSFLALARFPNSIPARRLLAACILAGADPFPFSPSTSAGCPSPVTAAPGLLIGGISSAAAHAAISLLQGGPAGVYEDVGCATLFAQASSALSAFSEAHDALSWTVDHASGFRSRLAAMNARGKAPAGLAGLGIIPGIVTPAAGPSQTRGEHIQDEGSDGTAALLASLTSSAADPSTSNLRPSQPIKVLVSPRQTSTSLAQQSQTLTSLGHLAAKGNRLAEAASSFESALDADRWNWAAWAGLCDVARVGSQRGVVDGGNCTDTLKRWSHTELGLHGLEEFLPDNMADWEALLVQLVAQEAEAETKWRQLGGGSGIAAPGGAGASQSQSQSQPQSSASQGGTASSQSQATSRLKASTNGASAQLEKGRSGTGTAGSNGLPTFVRAGSRTTTGARSTAAGNPGSNKRARSGLDGSVSSSTRNAASRSVPAFPGPSSENRTAAGAGSRSAIASSASARMLTTARTNVGSHALSRSQGHPSRADTGESAMGLADDELMLVDDMPATESGAALVEGRQNLLEDAAPVGLVREFEKGALVRRSTRTNAQAAAGAAAARTRVGAGTGAAVGGGIAAGRRVGGAVPGTVTGLRTGTGAGRGPQSTTTVSKSTALGRSQAGSAQGRVPAGASSSSSSTASRAGGMTSTRPDALGGRAPKSSSSTDSSLGTGSVTSLALPGRSDAAASATGKGTRRLGVAGATNGTTGTSNAAAAALSAAAAELDSVRAKRVEAEARISDAKAAASQVAQLWSDVDMDVLSTVRQLAEAYRTVRLYEGRKTAYLLRSVDDVTRALLGTMATTEEQQAELATNRAVYGDSPFSLGISDAVLNTEPVRCLLGRAAHDSARYAEAERHFDAARRNIAQPSSSCSSAIVPTRHMDIFSLVLFHLNREVKLSALAQDLGLLDANAAETHIACGNAFALQREHAQAMRAFKRAALIAPGCAYAYTLAGYEAIELSQLERAVGFFRSAIRVDMRHWNAWAGLGQIFLKIQKTDWAEAHYREAIGINPHHAVLKDLLGYTFETQGRWKEALDEYDAALAMSPKLAMTRLKRAELLSHMENYEDAHEELLRVAELVPDESRVHILLAKSYMRLGHGQFADPNYGSTGGGGDKSTSMAAQEPVPPSAYHEEIAFHLAAAIDLDPKNVRIVKAMGEGARTALKGGRRTVDMSAMDSTVDSSMYPVDQSGEVFEDGPEESGASRVTDEAMAEGALPSEDDEDDEEDLDDEDDEDDEDDDDVSDGEDGEDSDDDESDGTGEEEEDEGDSDGDDRIPGHDEDESENVEPRQTAAGEDSENAYRGRANRHAQNAQPQQQQHQHQPSMPSPGQAAANLSVSTTSSAAAGMSASTGDGSMSMSEEQSMELDI